MVCKTKLFPVFLFVVILFYSGGCQPLPDRERVEKDGRWYGVTDGHFGHDWWHYYKRALSFADGGFWESAGLDLQEAIRQRDDDKRDARKFGMHFIDYFPHRELGVALYYQGRFEEAAQELEISISTEESAKAQFYLDAARKAFLEKSQKNKNTPEVRIDSPQPSFITNAFSVPIRGVATSEAFVRHITVNNKAIPIYVSDREIGFCTDVAVVPGENKISVLATDLMGKTFQTSVTVKVDRIGPVVSIDSLISDVLKGFVFDDTGLAELTVNGQKFFLNGEQRFQLPEIHPEEDELTITATDLAGNVTRARIPFTGDTEVTGARNLLAQNAAFSEIIPSKTQVFSDSIVEGFIFTKESPKGSGDRLYAAYLTVSADDSPPLIELNDIKLNNSEYKVTYLDRWHIDGKISDEGIGLNRLEIDGEQIFRAKNTSEKKKDYFFNYLIKLRKGRNAFTLRCFDTRHNASSKTVEIVRKIPDIQKLGSRLKVAVRDFKRDQVGDDKKLSYGFEDMLTSEMLELRRFEFMNMEIAELLGNTQNIDCFLIGKILERENSVDIHCSLVTNESKILAQMDVYGENVDKSLLKLLSRGMALKLVDALPVVKGEIVNIEGKEIIVNFDSKHQVKEGMELIIYENDKKFTKMGWARVKSFTAGDLAVAELNKDVEPKRIRNGMGVITR